MTQAEEEGGGRSAGAGIRQVMKVPATKSEGDLPMRRIVSDVSTKVSVYRTAAAAEKGEEIELSLGLSLNGRFGVDPTRANNHLKRSSSVVEFNVVAPVMMMREEEEEEGKTTCRVPMMRTCSLPSETEEEWRRRKEQQCLRRMEAKRKRSEKQQRMSISTNYSSKVPRNRSRENFDEMINNVGGGGGGCPPLPPMMLENLGSQGSGSSGVTDDSHAAAQAAHKCSEVRSDESLPKSEKEPIVTHQMTKTIEKSGQLNGAVQMQNHSENSTNSDKGTKESVRDVLENMPSVSTRGHGPNGRRIEGFLYRYKNGEEVRIVCVCHGSFLTPAEFVKHAGGGDVLHPLKHIAVNPTPIL